ncbi:MAG: hypothetical protein JW722_03360 [Demequinaceae bacterium]|nr:hypothetical protein [Demequinaceae bacterium]
MTDEDKEVRDAFLALVERVEPKMAAHDERTWDGRWRSLLAETREWARSEQGETYVGKHGSSRAASTKEGLEQDDTDAGEFGDGSTGTVEDYEHGVYLQMLAERDD